MALLGNNTAGRSLPNISFFGSQSWTPGCTYQAYVYVIGAGGSGAGAKTSNGRTSGGGAGGCAVSLLTLTSGTSYTITVGAGGAYVNDTTSSGAAGGNSSLAGSDISTMTGNGGAAGVYSASSTAAGGAGGTASGGTILNNTGGAGGDCPSTNYAASGGGSVGIWSTGQQAPAGLATSGQPSMGGNVGFDSDTYTSTAQTAYTSNQTGNGGGIPSLPPFPLLSTQGIGSNGGGADWFATVPMRSGQVWDYFNRIISGNYMISPAAPLCGGNGVSFVGSYYMYGGSGSMGGGGGGVTTGTSGNPYSGAGGNGAVLIFPVDMG
jgi:hypothetical protein